ncbi:MAG: hypothetical protein WBA93_11495 [Microcoleaceae cyanobacterium]
MGNKNFDSGGRINQSGSFGVGINMGTFAGDITGGNFKKQTLDEVAVEIQQLLQQLEQSYPTQTVAEKMAVATQVIEIVDHNRTLKQRVIYALKSAGTEAFKEVLDHPVANLLVAAFEQYTIL